MEMTNQEVIEFLYNPENSHDCENCPYNEGFSDWQSRKPCGQWRCWVDMHTQSEEADE